MAKGNSDYEVGYGRPPISTRFKPGSSGNSKGRPPGARSFSAQFFGVTREKMTISVKGRTRQVAKSEAMFMQLMNSAVKGEPSAQRLVVDLMQRLTQAETGSAVTLDSDDQAVMDEFRKRLLVYTKAPKKPRRRKQ